MAQLANPTKGNLEMMGLVFGDTEYTICISYHSTHTKALLLYF